MIRGGLAGIALLVAVLPLAQATPLEPRGERIRDAILAESLAVRGEAGKDPLLLLAAARLLSDLRAPDGDGQGSRTASALATQAMLLAPQDTAVVELAGRLLQPRGKGLETGPLHVIRLVNPGGTDTQPDLQFEPGKEAEVYLHGDGRAALQLEVRTKGGEPVCRSDGQGDKALCRFTPLMSTYVVEVRNTGNSANRFRLLTN